MRCLVPVRLSYSQPTTRLIFPTKHSIPRMNRRKAGVRLLHVWICLGRKGTSLLMHCNNEQIESGLTQPLTVQNRKTYIEQHSMLIPDVLKLWRQRRPQSDTRGECLKRALSWVRYAYWRLGVKQVIPPVPSG